MESWKPKTIAVGENQVLHKFCAHCYRWLTGPKAHLTFEHVHKDFGNFMLVTNPVVAASLSPPVTGNIAIKLTTQNVRYNAASKLSVTSILNDVFFYGFPKGFAGITCMPDLYSLWTTEPQTDDMLRPIILPKPLKWNKCAFT
jgi:hypothetical protein